MTPAQPEKAQVPLSEVRTWATRRGLIVGKRGHLSEAVVGQFNRAHQRKQAISKNPKAAHQT